LAAGKPKVLAFHGAYHGLSYGALEVTHRADFRAPFQAQLGAFAEHLPYGCDLGAVETVLQESPIGAVLVEPILGRGGIVTPPDGWLSEVHRLCRAHGALLVLDEIFTGWGRTGDLFACQYEQVVPEILCIGKAMGGGLPISACVASAETMNCWGPSQGEALHTSTFLGNPLACAAAIAAIEVIVSDKLGARARARGEFLKARLLSLQDCFPHLIKDVRGRGLMLGMELAEQKFGMALVKDALKRGLFVLPAGDGSVIELIPPLIVTEEEIDKAVSILTDSLDKIGVSLCL
jgi:acetylornithine/succinyldiaminopimelate/putrescine aminotransferase